MERKEEASNESKRIEADRGEARERDDDDAGRLVHTQAAR